MRPAHCTVTWPPGLPRCADAMRHASNTVADALPIPSPSSHSDSRLLIFGESESSYSKVSAKAKEQTEAARHDRARPGLWAVGAGLSWWITLPSYFLLGAFERHE